MDDEEPPFLDEEARVAAGDEDGRDEEAGVAAGDEDGRDELIRRLVTLCFQNGVALPPDLQGELHAAEDPSQPYVPPCLARRSTHYFLQRCQRQMSGVAADDIGQLFQLLKSIGEGQFKYEVRLEDVSYTVTATEAPGKDGLGRTRRGDVDMEDQPGKSGTALIPTVLNSHPLYKLLSNLKGGSRPVKVKKTLMEGINLRLESSKTYLVLGAPGSGKSLLLKTIANVLRCDKDRMLGGSVTINGEAPSSENVVWSNLVSYVDQLDKLHSMLTVKETCDFAFNCRSGGTHRKSYMPTDDPEINEIISTMDKEGFRVQNVMKKLGLARVKDTFVGDDSKVRGVSGGERKRVTLAEMVTRTAPIICLDEISTGLDAATTYDIMKLLSRVAVYANTVAIASLLQPSPEVLALFDELILLDSGKIVYSGPVGDVVAYFQNLGYAIPEKTDTADWLQALPTAEGKKFLRDSEYSDRLGSHLTREQFVEAYNASQLSNRTIKSLKEPLSSEVSNVLKTKQFSERFRNRWFKSIQLVFQRELLLWRRDVFKLKAKMVQNCIMGVVVGTVFWQIQDSQSILGVIFQSLLMMSLGAMLRTPPQLDARDIFYKHQDANFFPTWTFVVGRTLADLPQYLIDSLMYGTLVYWFAGLAHDNGASVVNYFVFILIILAASFVASMMFSILSSAVPNKASAQAAMAVMMVIMVIFSGFTVQPDVIPSYWIWVYWMNLFAWMLRSAVVNEFQSGAYDDMNPVSGRTRGETLLELFGFTLDGEPYDYEWVWYGIAFAAGIGMIAMTCSYLCLKYIRREPLRSADPSVKSTSVGVEDGTSDSFDLPFKTASLSFRDIRYSVTSSVSKEPIELLKGVDGYIEGGKMTALMGSSGAGKTTLMDVLALRKSTGEIEGQVMLNGHGQERNSFRRCTGYVEQFDTQTPQLTVLETVEFSAKLRLEENDPYITKERISRFVSKIMRMLELSQIQDSVVGGLSFEQSKRLSIGVELAANPSIIFLDEPTSGLDARAASIVMRGLKRIAESGRAVSATIHQPSQSIFNSFDSLLLLKRGGEPVYFGELGEDCASLVGYLERFSVTQKIQPGENPAAWMLNVIGAGSSSNTSHQFDYARCYANSDLRRRCLGKISEMEEGATADNLVSFKSKYATSKGTQSRAVFKRLMKIYWRSPSYNLVRVAVSVIVALILGSVYASQRMPQNESDMNSRITSIFVSTVFLGVSSFNTILPLFEVERNMFYRHKAALMYNPSAIDLAFTFAEIPFILWSSMAFCVMFYFLLGFSAEVYKFFLYYLFFSLNLGLFTYLGQALMSLVRDSEIAQTLGSAIVGMSALFCGILIRPQFISVFWTFMYWLMPLHYILEGLITGQFHEDNTPILATPGSNFYVSLLENGQCESSSNMSGSPEVVTCVGTAEEWVQVSFGGFFSFDNIWKADFTYLVGLCVLSRIICYIALKKLNYLRK